jgi:hypothetical protein
MATAPRRKRPRGQIVQLSSGSLQVRVFVGRDPVTKKRHYLQETVRHGPDADAEAEKALRRLLVQVDEQLNPRTSATVRRLLDKHFVLLDVERTTMATYQNLARTHIVPLIQRPVRCADRDAVALGDLSRRGQDRTRSQGAVEDLSAEVHRGQLERIAREQFVGADHARIACRTAREAVEQAGRCALIRLGHPRRIDPQCGRASASVSQAPCDGADVDTTRDEFGRGVVP